MSQAVAMSGGVMQSAPAGAVEAAPTKCRWPSASGEEGGCAYEGGKRASHASSADRNFKPPVESNRS